MKPELTQAFLKECFDYDPDTGILTWKVRPRHHFSRTSDANQFNARFAGHAAGTAHGTSYTSVTLRSGHHKRQIMAHRAIWLWTTGQHADVIDHIDRNRSNNSWTNLRSVTQSTNVHNQKRRLGKAGHTGIHQSKRQGYYYARIEIAGNRIHLGIFKSLADAVAARKAAELHYHPQETVATATDAPVIRSKPFRPPHPAQMDLFDDER